MAMNDRQDSKSPNASAALKTGARNDDSSLFSLDMIRQAEESATRASRERDDSGLIDLHALAALSGTEPAQVTTSPLVVSSTAGLFGAPAVPVSAPVAPAPSAAEEANPFARSSKSKTPLLVIGGVVAVGAAVAAFFGMQGSGTPAATADATAAMAPAITAAAPVPAPVTAAAPTPEPQIVAATPGQRAPAAEAPKAAAPVAVAKAAPAKAAAPKAAAAPAAAPKEAAKPAGPVCDLTCQMQKAVSKPK